MRIQKVAFLYEGRTNSVFRETFLGVPGALRASGLGCLSLDLFQVPLEDVVRAVRAAGVDLVLQMTRTPGTAWPVAQAKAAFGVPYVLWNLEEPNATVVNDLLALAPLPDLYATLDARMIKCHAVPAMYLPLWFDDLVYYDRQLSRDLGAVYLGQYTSKRLREHLRPLVAALEERPDSLVNTYRPMLGWGGWMYRRLAWALDRLPVGFSMRASLAFQRSTLWRQDHSLRPQGFFANRDEEEKAFLYGRARIGVGFSRIFGWWEDELRRRLPQYERDEHGNCVQLKSRQFEIVGAGALLLSDESRDLNELFVPGVEYVPYDYTAPQDFREKLDFYLRNDTARLKIARAGYERGQRDHTLTRRLGTLLDACRQRW